MGKAMMGTGEADGEGRASKAADMAINNPLIDDYTLKGAKGLLVNITGGNDLTLFEVDEAVNKVRAEVDPDAEIIIGAINDSELNGKMRVSIVATSLDGQHPESKSIINMVHRIQNRNPGYSDFSKIGSTASFNFSNTMSRPISHGANALKIDNEIIQEQITQNISTDEINEGNSQNTSADSATIVDHASINEHERSFTREAIDSTNNQNDISNDLKEFGVDKDAPDLFNSDHENSNSSGFLLNEDNQDEEDDLEIPAFLRRQK